MYHVGVCGPARSREWAMNNVIPRRASWLGQRPRI